MLTGKVIKHIFAFLPKDVDPQLYYDGMINYMITEFYTNNPEYSEIQYEVEDV